MNIGLGKAIGGTAIIGLIMGSWGTIKSIFFRIYSIFVVKYDLDEEMYEALSLYCWTYFRRVPISIRQITCDNMYIVPKKEVGYVAAEKIGKMSVIFFKGIKPLLFGGEVSGSHNTSYSSPSFCFIRGTFNGEKLIANSLELYNEKRKVLGGEGKRFFIRYMFGTLGKSFIKELKEESSKAPDKAGYSWLEMKIKMGVFRPIGWKQDELGFRNTSEGKLMENLALTAEQKDYVEESVRWRKSKDWYALKSIAWRRGYMFHGIPGTGKSKLALASAEHLDMPIYVFDLSTMTNEDFVEKWREMQSSNPCLALIEDLDTIFDGRINLNRTAFQNCLTFDCFLNVIDGVGNTEGIFTIITTNKTEKIDPAIGSFKSGNASRPGRIDRMIEFKELEEVGRRKIAARILGNGDLSRVVIEGAGETGAQFQERCARIALNKYWEKKNLVK